MGTAQRLDPEIAAVVDDFPAFALSDETLPSMRGVIDASDLSDSVVRTEQVIPGDPPVTVRVHRRADATGPRPAVVSMHGGGYVLGSSTMDDPLFDRWCQDLDIVGVSVEYRLAPEIPYPGPLDDCYRALRWTYDNADDLGVDVSCLGVHGVSAGGGLAAALALLARDRGEVPLAFQVLDCPMLDDRQITPSSQLDGLAIWTRDSNEFGWRSYLGSTYGRDDVPYHAAPARALDLAGLPPAFVSVGSADGFHDEDVDYALRLNQANVPTELHVYPGAPHGYQLAADAALCERSRRDKQDWVGRQVGA